VPPGRPYVVEREGPALGEPSRTPPELLLSLTLLGVRLEGEPTVERELLRNDDSPRLEGEELTPRLEGEEKLLRLNELELLRDEGLEKLLRLEELLRGEGLEKLLRLEELLRGEGLE